MSLASLIATGTKVWLDGVEPAEVARNHAWGATGATSNPAIVSKIIEHGHFDDRIHELVEQGLGDEQIAWELDDELVRSAQETFSSVWARSKGDDGYVSFELDPLIEDKSTGIKHSQRVKRYVELAEKWSAWQFQKRLQRFRVSRGCLYQRARRGFESRRAGNGRDCKCQTDLAGKPGVL